MNTPSSPPRLVGHEAKIVGGADRSQAIKVGGAKWLLLGLCGGVILGGGITGSYLRAGFKQAAFNQEMALQSQVYSILIAKDAYAAAVVSDADQSTQAAIHAAEARNRFVFPVIQSSRSPMEVMLHGIDPAAERAAHAATMAWEKRDDALE